MRATALLGVLLAAACGGESKSKDDQAGKPVDSAPGAGVPAAKPAPARPLGVSDPSAFNYPWGKGEKPFDAVAPALKKKDWAAVRDAAKATLAADAGHLDASWELAHALIALGDHAGAVAPLTAALSGDWLRWSKAADAADFAAFWQSDAGKAFRPAFEQMGNDFLERARLGVFVVARRTAFKPPAAKPKAQWAATRGELYSYDRASKRYLRITHTDHQVAGWFASPDAGELVYVSWSELTTPATDADPTLIGKVKIGRIAADKLTPDGPEARLEGAHRRVVVQFLAGDELWVTGLPAQGRWGVADGKSYSLDAGIGKLKKAKAPPAEPGAPTLVVDYEHVAVSGAPPDDIQAEPEAATFRLVPTNQTVSLPAGETVAEGSYFWAPDKAHLVVRTVPQPCAGKPESTLYLVDASTGKLKSILRADSPFGVRWIDNDHFVYEDDAGYLRLYDAEVRTQAEHWKVKGGIGLNGLGAQTRAVCTEAPPEGSEAPPAGTDPMPPEETP
ncbi:MAG TPA: hypothetical protein VL172_07760 [Kofleriaceae bacterium]|nr:hypothetical protein [Kofleriaceae bacterium]